MLKNKLSFFSNKDNNNRISRSNFFCSDFVFKRNMMKTVNKILKKNLTANVNQNNI